MVPTEQSRPMTDFSTTPTTPPRRKPSLALKLTVLGASVVLMLLAVEIGMRIFIPVTDVPFQFWDPLVGVRRIPNQTGRCLSGGYIDAPYHFNAQGWNHPEDYVTTKPPAARRVCVVGDSFVEALHVPYEQSFFGVAEKTMSRPDRPVQWYAFGCSGFGPTHESLVIHHYALDYHPDVVVMVFIGNDPWDSSIYLAPQEPSMARFELDTDDRLVLIPPTQYIPSSLKRFSANFAVVRYFMIQRRLYTPGSAPGTAGGHSVRAITADAATQPAALPTPMRAARTWKLIEKVLERTQRDCADRGAVFALAWEGHRYRIEAAFAGQTFQPPPVEEDPFCEGARLYEMGNQYLQPIAAKLNIPFIDLTDAMIEKVRRAKQLSHFPDDAHWNRVGHEAVGEAFARWVETLLPKK